MTADFLATDIVAPPRPQSQAGFIVAIAAMLAALLALAFWFEMQNKQTEVARAAVRESYARRLQATELMVNLTTAETAQRGYLLMGDEAFIRPYQPARTAVSSGLARLEAEYPRGTNEHVLLERLKAIADAKFKEMSDAITRRDRLGIASAVARVSDTKGLHLMMQARETITTLVNSESRSLAERTAVVRERNAAVVDLVWALVALGAVTIVAGFFLRMHMRRARYRLQLERYEASARLHAIFDSTIDAILIFNPSGTLETMNAAAATLFGRDGCDNNRRDASVLLNIADGDGTFHQRIGMVEGRLRHPIWLDRTIRLSNGDTLPVDIALGLMPLPSGVHVVAAIHDISERKAMERLKDEFVATVSHELRTPLTSVIGSLGLLRSGSMGDLPAPARRLVEIAENNSRRLIRLINDILDIEKIGSGRMHFESEPLDIRRLAMRAIEGVAGLAEEAQVRIEADLPPSTLIVRGDFDRLLQALSNLLSNAVRFSPASGLVLLSAVNEGARVVLSIEDEGPGIPPEFESRVFQRFAQAGGGRGKPGGTGLGLAISREIIEAHEGSIWFGKSIRGGARFSLSLPLAQAEPQIGAEWPDRRSRILLCEDNEDARDVIRGILEAEGCIVDCVLTARQAKETAKNGQYDGIVLDLKLPDASGLEAVRALRQRSDMRAIPIIVVSGTADDIRQEPGAAAREVVDWINKPLDQPRLVSAVQRAIRHSAANRPTLLHIDDNADMLEVTAAALADQGRMLRATSIQSARAVLARETIDIAILDLNLVDGSGLELLPDLLNADGTAIPTIIYSAQDVLPDISEKVDAVLVKSRWSLPNLSATIRRLLTDVPSPAASDE